MLPSSQRGADLGVSQRLSHACSMLRLSRYGIAKIGILVATVPLAFGRLGLERSAGRSAIPHKHGDVSRSSKDPPKESLTIRYNSLRDHTDFRPKVEFDLCLDTGADSTTICSRCERLFRLVVLSSPPTLTHIAFRLLSLQARSEET